MKLEKQNQNKTFFGIVWTYALNRFQDMTKKLGIWERKTSEMSMPWVSYVNVWKCTDDENDEEAAKRNMKRSHYKRSGIAIAKAGMKCGFENTPPFITMLSFTKI